MESDLFFLTNNIFEIRKEKIAIILVIRILKQEEFSKNLTNCIFLETAFVSKKYFKTKNLRLRN
ncbi:MAG: hypothetical protein ACI9Z4_000778 [Polaribacter sp.]|jgi:hypothetical protein